MHRPNRLSHKSFNLMKYFLVLCACLLLLLLLLLQLLLLLLKQAELNDTPIF